MSTTLSTELPSPSHVDLDDLRRRVLLGEEVSKAELIQAIRHLREGRRQATVKREEKRTAKAAKASKAATIDLESLFGEEDL
jgi:3-dehydroquinate dehydratase